MPLYDCTFLLKPQVSKAGLMDLITRVAKHVYTRNGVITDLKSFGTVQLGYGIKKLDGRYFQGQMMQMTMMATPNINKELHYLNNEERLLRWLLVRHRPKMTLDCDRYTEGNFRGQLNKYQTNIGDGEDKDDVVAEPGDDEYEIKDE